MLKITKNRERHIEYELGYSHANAMHGLEPDVKLTDRELEVLRLSAEGYNIKEIAAQLNVSFATIDTHSRNVVRKINARNMKNAIALGLRNGMIK